MTHRHTRHRTTTPPTGLPVHRAPHDPSAHIIQNPALTAWAKRKDRA